MCGLLALDSSIMYSQWQVKFPLMRRRIINGVGLGGTGWLQTLGGAKS